MTANLPEHNHGVATLWGLNRATKEPKRLMHKSSSCSLLDLSLGKQGMFVWLVTSREDLTDTYYVITRATWAWYCISARHTHCAASLGQLWHIWCLPLGTVWLFVWWHWHCSNSSEQLTGCLGEKKQKTKKKKPSVHVGAEPTGRKKGLPILPTGSLSCTVRLLSEQCSFEEYWFSYIFVF